jgi:hypothetical protein
MRKDSIAGDSVAGEFVESEGLSVKTHCDSSLEVSNDNTNLVNSVLRAKWKENCCKNMLYRGCIA